MREATQVLGNLYGNDDTEINDICVHERGQYVATCDDEGLIKVLDCGNGHLTNSIFWCF